MSQISRQDQQITYLLKTTKGYTEVKSINHWRVAALLHEHTYFLEDQVGYILPVFRQKPV